MCLLAQMTGVHVKGVAFLCFTADDAKVYGILAVDGRSVLRLTGKTSSCPSTSYHECCFDTAPTFYEFVVTDDTGMELNRELAVKPIMRLGGDNCSLVCDDRFHFTTDQLIAGQKADEYIAKYFSRHLVNQDCYVCIGPMSIDCDTATD